MQVGRGRERDAEFAEFVAGVHPSLLRTAHLLTGESAGAEDLVQAALVRVYVHWGRASGWDAPRAYARKVMVNLFATWSRRRWNKGVPRSEAPVSLATVDPAESVATRQDLAHALAELPRAQRAVLVLRFCEDLTVEQTAELLGCSPGTVKSRTSRALEQLRRSAALSAHTEGSAG